MGENVDLIDMTADIVVAYVGKNTLSPAEVPKLIRDVHDALAGSASADEAAAMDLVPAVPIDQSVLPDHIVCLEDGKKFKSLKRHLTSQYDMTPEEYRARWGLPSDYPMVAPNYAKARSELAKKLGLGRKSANDADAKSA